MSWAWLTGIPVLLLGFIGTVFGILASVIAIVQFMSPVGRKIGRSRAEGTTVKPVTALAGPDGTCLDASNLSRYCRDR